MRRTVSAVLCLMLLGLPLALTEDNKFTEQLLQNRYQLNVDAQRMSGTGFPVLQNALAGAQFVLIGEDHGISQIPQFVGAVCDMLGPQGFHTMAIETGPLAATELQQWVASDSGRDSLINFEKQFSDSIAFYNFQEEYSLLSRCARSAQSGKFHLWGLDQELMGSTGVLLTRILETRPGKEATEQTELLRRKNEQALAVADKSGNPGDIFMMSASDDELNKLRDLLRKDGNATSQGLIDALIKSRDIYKKNMNGSGYESNRERALLMKSTFAADYKQWTQTEGAPPKVLFKFGAWHMYKGINPLRNNDVGNFVAELADGQGNKSLHIVILGVKGSQLRFAGIGKPYQPGEFNLVQDKDSDFIFLKPMFDNLESNGWTMFDLRGLRKGFRSLEPVDKELERMVFGYDLLVLIPNATPSAQIR